MSLRFTVFRPCFPISALSMMRARTQFPRPVRGARLLTYMSETGGAMYHQGNRRLQDAFGSRALADRLVERLNRSTFNDEDKALIESVPFFFIATADAEGRPDCSVKGGLPGFVQVVSPDALVFTTATACSGASATSGSIRMWGCCFCASVKS